MPTIKYRKDFKSKRKGDTEVVSPKVALKLIGKGIAIATTEITEARHG